MNYVKVEGNEDLVRDPHTNAIINTNVAEYKKYKETKSLMMSRKQQINNQSKEIEEIKQEIAEIKTLLFELIKVSRDANTTVTNNNT